MRRYFLILAATMIFSISAVAQTDKDRPVNANAVAAGFVFDRSDAVEPTNSVGFFLRGVRNVTVRGLKVTLINDFQFQNDNAYPFLLEGGNLLVNDTIARVPITDLEYPFLGTNARPYIQLIGTVRRQSNSLESRTQFNPGVGLGFQFDGGTDDSNGTTIDYSYMIDTNTVKGHRVGIEYRRKLQAENPKYFVFTGVTGFTGSFDPFPLSYTPGLPPSVTLSESVYGFTMRVGIERR